MLEIEVTKTQNPHSKHRKRRDVQNGAPSAFVHTLGLLRHPRGSCTRGGSCPIRSGGRYNGGMYHYDPNTALEELNEDATLPNPVHVRDMILRKKLTADRSLELNRLFVEYQKFFGEAQKLGKEILKQLAG